MIWTRSRPTSWSGVSIKRRRRQCFPRRKDTGGSVVGRRAHSRSNLIPPPPSPAHRDRTVLVSSWLCYTCRLPLLSPSVLNRLVGTKQLNVTCNSHRCNTAERDFRFLPTPQQTRISRATAANSISSGGTVFWWNSTHTQTSVQNGRNTQTQQQQKRYKTHNEGRNYFCHYWFLIRIKTKLKKNNKTTMWKMNN